MARIKAWQFVLLAGLVLAGFGCSKAGTEETRSSVAPLTEEWKDYWYSGTAELTRYELEQARYGEIHKGDAVLIFVTEDFFTDQQVKYERGPKDNVTSVLKLNHTSRFWTGVYPYSMISSIFTPVDGLHPTLKVATSVQEWCGHGYSQLNLRDDVYHGTLHSYFQGESDRQFTLDRVMPEDAIWTQIRLRPDELPTGDIKLIPGSQFLRLRHRDFGAETARASKTTFQDPDLSAKALTRYRVEYQGIDRTLEIIYESEFPYTIVAWEEQNGDGLTTRAVRTHAINSPNWGQNSLADSVVRKQLGL